MSDDAKAREAAHGEKMITLTLWFWTNDLADQKGRFLPKHAWAAGMVGIDRNAAHGITPGKTKPFHSLLDLGAVIEKVLIEHGVMLHPPKRMQKYLASAPEKAG